MKLEATPETKAILAGPIHLSKTLQALLISAITGLPVLIEQIKLVPGLILPTWVNHVLMVVSIVALWLSPMLARSAGIGAAAVVAEQSGAIPAVREVPFPPGGPSV